ncbi:hypothetical protein KC332_g17871 [Hortaea werneckii]|uniref:N-acetyltransferase domain-containing protein n=2 Tax=Hortaea werneckii TaxID=91943 RepID=A0A3M7HZY2_HORWE|nr:hypothetical protein KC350_g18014 [Hortaea werneckii]OTA25936.1 hypothetical protein BTJ68_12416 [Hortaea werneckii EXF-2000]KAI6790504.1 hypothetical protein KC358_g17991 [Hortaea werneckii]KAI6896683.1 hypothetical protein KC348_g17946 [Hortaea werneckii]KAI6918231.1 hypothetical protein KC341_g18010 [Hortaea werneckii]
MESVAAAATSAHPMEPALNLVTATHTNDTSPTNAASNPSKHSEPPKFDRVDSAMGLVGNESITPTPAPAAAATPLQTNDTGVRIVQLHEWKAASLSLAEAFADDHSCLYFLNTPDTVHWSAERKWRLHLRMMGSITYAHLLNGLVLTSGPNYASIALWMPPGKNMDDWLTILRSGLWRLKFLLSPEGQKRFFTEFLPLLHTTKSQVLRGGGGGSPEGHDDEEEEPSYYLVYLGTRPSGRGKGYARQVVEYLTARADREGRKCYLESSHGVNREMYRKWGFEVRKRVYLQRSRENVELEIMVREPLLDGV